MCSSGSDQGFGSHVLLFPKAHAVVGHGVRADVEQQVRAGRGIRDRQFRSGRKIASEIGLTASLKRWETLGAANRQTLVQVLMADLIVFVPQSRSTQVRFSYKFTG